MRRFRAFAKINLCLAVLGRRADGYHEIDTVMQSIGLFDELRCEPLDIPEIRVECDAPGVPEGEGNIVWKALERLRVRHAPGRGLRVRLAKTIPVEAGLGGGSADAACALGAADRIWALGLDSTRLEEIAAEVGSDVPFFVRGGTRRCRGRGERTDRVAPLPPSRWAIIKPSYGLSTASVYAQIRSALTADEARIRMFMGSLAKRDLSGALARTFNDLESAAMSVRPEAGRIREWMLGLGMAGVVLAGSGSAWAGCCPEGLSAERVRREAEERGWRAFVVEAVEQGWIEVEA